MIGHDLIHVLLPWSVAVLLLLSGYVVIDASRAIRQRLPHRVALQRWRWRLYAAIGATAAGFVAIICALSAVVEGNRYVG